MDLWIDPTLDYADLSNSDFIRMAGHNHAVGIGELDRTLKNTLERRRALKKKRTVFKAVQKS